MISQLFRTLTILFMAFRLLLDYLWLDFTDRFRTDASRRKAQLRAFSRGARRLRLTALRLNGLIIKVGQFLSARADVFPESFTRELASLQDAVPAAPFDAIRRRVEAELGAPIDSRFADFSPEALASASLGQVHLAKLKEGPTVAVKILRPGVEQTVVTDMAALRRIVGWLERYTQLGHRFDLKAMVDEFEDVTYQEMDYRLEAENIRRFRKNFADVPGIDVPFPYDNLVSEKLLVMEYKEGMKLTERDRLEEAGLSPAALSERLVDAFLKQLIIDGFVHVDPHPGNLMVQADGTLVFLDFGMMGSITADDRRIFSSLMAAMLARDLDAAVANLRELGVLRKGADIGPLKRALSVLLDHFSGVKLKPGAQFEAFLAEMREWLYEEPLQFPARFLYMARGIGLVAGLATGLNPAIDWATILKERALPLFEERASGPQGEGERPKRFNWRKIVSEWFGPGASTAVEAVVNQVAATGVNLVRLPGQIERTLNKLESGAVRVQVEMTGVTERLDWQSRMVSRGVWGLLIACAGITGAMLRINGLLLEAKVSWGLGAFFLLALIGNMLMDRGSRRRSSSRSQSSQQAGR